MSANVRKNSDAVSTLKRAAGWMVWIIPAMLATGCASVSSVAICEGTLSLRDAHTVALLEDGGPQSQETGARLLDTLDAGCADAG